MSIQFFHERLNSTHKPTRFSAHLYQFRVEVFRICHCQSEWYFRWPCQEADKWGKDRRWVIHKWFIGLLFDAVWMLLYSIRFIVVLFCFVLNFISSFFLNCKVFGCFFFVNLVLIVWWIKFWTEYVIRHGHQVTKSIRCDLENLPENWFLLWKSWLKVVHICLATFLALIIY